MTEHEALNQCIKIKLERSSLGTPEAQRQRARIADGDAQAIVRLAASYPVEICGADLGGQPLRQHL